MEELLTSLPPDRFTLGWLSSHLHKRSFGIIVMVLAVIAMVPGISYVAGLLLLAPAIEMIAGRVAPTFPRWVSRRSLSVRPLKSTVQRLALVLKHLEKAIRPRWLLPPGAMKRVVGVAVLLLTVLLLLTPLPLIQIGPGIIIIILGVAYLEDDGLILAIGLLATLAFTAASAGAGA
ncbi:MAG: exopolysaccharide biosynthesis protein [Xanthobacteraceae bacterium]